MEHCELVTDSCHGEFSPLEQSVSKVCRRRGCKGEDRAFYGFHFAAVTGSLETAKRRRDKSPRVF